MPDRYRSSWPSSRSSALYHRRVGHRRKGAILIIAIGVLTLLAILGATFANLMRLERKATQNYLDSQEVDLITDSAIERVIADLRGAENWRHFSPYRARWLYKIVGVDDLAHGLDSLDNDRSGSLVSIEAARERPSVWEVIAEKQRRYYRYKTKIIDCSAQINLNGKQDTLGRMLDHLAEAIQKSPRLPGSRMSPFQFQNELLRGHQIVEFRNKLEGHRFRSKTQLRELIGLENFERVKDFITTDSWEDPYTYCSAEGVNEIVDLGMPGGGTVGAGAVKFPFLYVESPGAQISAEPRSPVNVNTAPEEVLIAVLQGIACRRVFPYAHLTYAAIDQGATEAGARPIGREERDTAGGGTNTLPRGVWVFSDRLGEGIPYDKARAIAQRIIAQRKETPFMAWSTGDGNVRGGFAEFINRLEESFFPSPDRAIVIDPKQPILKQVDNEVRNGGSQELSRIWKKGHDQKENSVRRKAGEPYDGQFAFYYEMVRSSIIANANPNTRINRYNPNAPAWQPVDKSDLVRFDNKSGLMPRKGHTTEFCFDSNGIFEVTTLAEISEAAGRAPRPGEMPPMKPLYQKPMRTVVKVWDVLRHTNQLHFEKTFSTGERSSRNNRIGVITTPDPMVALTDAVSAGSKRDGAVILAGYNDARRLLVPPASRFQQYRTPESITFAHGFQDRDDTSYAQLRRLGRTATVSKEWGIQMDKVLDGSYSKRGARYTRMYTREELVTLAFNNQGQMNQMPVVDTEQLGTDLMPDGFFMSLFNASHLGTRLIQVPAHERMGQSTKGGTARFAGAGTRQPLQGNVPYYDGGLAFWVKFAFNGDDPVFSGLIGCTQVIEDVGQRPQDSEGTQFYIFKNTEGQLRIVRMYYHQAYPDVASGGGEGGGGESGGGDGGAAGGIVEPWPQVSKGDPGGGGGGKAGENPIVKFLDERKLVARCDYTVDVRNFRAHEWHHIAVDWNDASPSTAIQVTIDFEKAQERPYIRQAGDASKAWVRLNCRRPRDELFIGGFIRSQYASDSGVFKWFTNSDTPSNGPGIVPIQAALKKILANATIDELICYEGTFQGVRNYFGPGGAPGYFTNRKGEYANVFEVPLPPEVDYVTLRSFEWTAYYPAHFTPREGQPLAIAATQSPLQCQVFPGRENIPEFNEPWQASHRNTTNLIAGHKLYRREAKGLVGTNADLVYQFHIFAGRVQAGPQAGGCVQTPVLDDVTLTYYLPNPKILAQEEAEEASGIGLTANRK